MSCDSFFVSESVLTGLPAAEEVPVHTSQHQSEGTTPFASGHLIVVRETWSFVRTKGRSDG